MGAALCCIVAPRPLVTMKSPVVTRRGITSLNPEDDLQWRTNISFSPVGYSRDGLENDTRDAHQGPAAQSSRSRGRKYLDPMANLVSASRPQKARWLSASRGNRVIIPPGSRTQRSQPRCSNELSQVQGLDRSSSAMSMSFRSSTTFSESSAPWESSSTKPFSPSCCSYSRVFCNPVSDWENPDISTNPRSRFLRLQTPPQSRISDDEPTPNLSYSTSSKEMLLEVETKVQNQRFPSGSMTPTRCGVCRNLLSQKSPWCAYKLMRSRDMPTAGVFPCHHVYHVECLDQVTSKAQTRDPSCPVCSNTIGAMEQPLIKPETLQTALRSLRRSHSTMESEPLRIPSNDNQRDINRRSQKWQKLRLCFNTGVSSSSRDPR